MELLRKRTFPYGRLGMGSGRLPSLLLSAAIGSLFLKTLKIPIRQIKVFWARALPPRWRWLIFPRRLLWHR